MDTDRRAHRFRRATLPGKYRLPSERHVRPSRVVKEVQPQEGQLPPPRLPRRARLPRHGEDEEVDDGGGGAGRHTTLSRLGGPRASRPDAVARGRAQAVGGLAADHLPERFSKRNTFGARDVKFGPLRVLHLETLDINDHDAECVDIYQQLLLSFPESLSRRPFLDDEVRAVSREARRGADPFWLGDDWFYEYPPSLREWVNEDPTPWIF